MIKLSAVFAGLCALSLVSACATDDNLSSDDSFVDEGGKSDAVSSEKYFTFERDTRKCVSPKCGGWWVASLNESKTKCADGKKEQRCYVAELDFAASGLSALPGERGVVVGKIIKKVFPSWGNLGAFSASKVYIAGTTAEASGDFVQVTLSGVRCKTTPCPFFTEHKLNTTKSKNLAELDLESLGLDEATYEAAQIALTGEGLIVAAKHTNVVGPGGSMVGRKATQVYLPAVVSAECHKTGCSGTICSDETVFTTCQFEPWMACFADAVCERQADGVCGFTASPVVDECVAEAVEPQAECQKTGCSGTICSDETVFTTCQFEPWMTCYADATCERQADGVCGFTASPAIDECVANPPTL